LPWTQSRHAVCIPFRRDLSGRGIP
jgi:hypothetical protein